MIEPLTSLLQREFVILAKNYGELSRTSSQIGRLLLRLRAEYGTLEANKGKSGTNGSLSLPSSDPFQFPLDGDHD